MSGRIRNRNFFVKQMLLAFFDVLILLSSVFAAIFLYFYLKTPIAAALPKKIVSRTTVIYDRTGKHVLYEIHGEENRKLIPHDKIPDFARITTIAAEDDRFYSHNGIDPLAVLRAIKINMENGDNQQGGSTITQQLARNAYFSREKTFRRKFLEAIMAIKIERKYTKNQILDMYFNEIPFGSNAYGLETAAETFFGKPAINLTLDEAALLAALPKATTYYSPYGTNVDELIARQKKIIQRAADLNLIDKQTALEAKKIDTLKKVIPFKQSIEAPHFVFYVRNVLEKQFGKDAVENGGLQVYTTLNYDMQKMAEKIIQEESANNLKRYGASNASLVSINPKNGEILAMVGSKNYFDTGIDGQVNVAISPRQPGSSFKPFAYAAAFEKGYQPETFVLDAATNFGPDGSGRNYIPRNYDGKFHGLLTMRQALAMSLNVPAVKTLYVAGVDDTIDLAHRLGITTLNDRNRYGLSLVLGGGEVKLLDMASGFSVFANDGKKNPATAILKVTGPNGQLYQADNPANTQVLDPQIARKINSILSDNAARVPIFGPNNRLFIPGRTVAAKTGTTQEFRDAWTIGYTPDITTGVWAGNNDNRPMRAGADGSYVAAPIWNKFMVQVLQGYPDQQFVAYDRPIGSNAKLDVKLAYFKKSSGKQISEKKAQKLGSGKVETRVEVAKNNSPTNIFSFLDTPFASNLPKK